MKYVAYWYQFFTRCEELVPIFHSVKFAKCEICGSTQPYPQFNRGANFVFVAACEYFIFSLNSLAHISPSFLDQDAYL